MYICTYASMHACLHVCMCVCMPACMYVCVHAGIHTYYTYTYTHTHTHTHAYTYTHKSITQSAKIRQSGEYWDPTKNVCNPHFWFPRPYCLFQPTTCLATYHLNSVCKGIHIIIIMLYVYVNVACIYTTWITYSV